MLLEPVTQVLMAFMEWATHVLQWIVQNKTVLYLFG